MRIANTKYLSVLLAASLMLQCFEITASAKSDIPEAYIESLPLSGTTDARDSSVSEKDLFPGLPEEYELSAEQMAQKKLLAGHTDETVLEQIENFSAPHAEGEVVYLTDSAEDAQIVAEAFGGTLDSYAYDVAVISLSEDTTVEEAVIAAANEEVLLPAVWPNYYKTLYEDYSDPALSEAAADYQWQHAAVGDTYAWSAGYTGDGIKVGILDTGIRNSHEEFTGRLVQHLDMSGDTAVDDTTDVQGHGTHVAGIVAANLNNGKGGSGIAPKASLYMYRVADSSGSIDAASEYRAVYRAISDGVDIINMSFGSGIYDGNEETVMQAAYQAGIALFAAAGNSSTTGESYPASYNHVCSVASSQQDGSKSYFSNYNHSVDLIFPGTGIYSTSYTSDSGYEYKNGTSMACPVASGVAAVILSGAEDVPALSGQTGSDRVDALFTVMEKNAVKSSSSGTGFGTTYLPSVFQLAVDSPDAAPADPVFSLSSGVTISGETVTLALTSASGTGVSIYYSTNGKNPVLKNGIVINGTLYSSAITIGGSKKVTVKAIAINPLTGKSSKVSSAVYYFAPSPSNVNITAAGGVNKLAAGNSLALKAAVFPDYAASQKVTWSVSPANGGVTINASGKVTATASASTGTYTVLAQAGTLGDTVTGTYILTVIRPSSLVRSVKFTKKKFTMSISSTDGEDFFIGSTDSGEDRAANITVTYTDGSLGGVEDVVFTSSNPRIATVSNTGKVTALSPGTTVVTATSNDGGNKSASCTITVRRLAQKITLTGSDKLAVGRSITLKAAVFPEDVSSSSLDWSVTGTGVTVKKGKVTASKNAAGTYMVTASSTDGSGITESHVITIVSDPIQKISVPKTISLFTTAGNYHSPTSASLNAVVTGGDVSAVIYSSSAPGVAAVDSEGNIQAISCGKAKILCEAADGSGKKAACTVTVSAPMSRLTIVAPERNSGVVCVGSSLKLKAQIGTSYGIPKNKKINWSVQEGSEDKITVNKNGVIKAKSLGAEAPSGSVNSTAYVAAEAADGSGASTTYAIRIYRKVARFQLMYQKGYLIPIAVFDNKNFSYNLPCQTTITTTSKSASIGHQDTYYTDSFGIKISAFYLTVADPTTTKTSAQSNSLTSKDGIRVKVTVQLEPNGKKASKTLILIRTEDGKLYVLQ